MDVVIEARVGDVTWSGTLPLEEYYKTPAEILQARLLPLAAFLIDQITDGERAKRELRHVK